MIVSSSYIFKRKFSVGGISVLSKLHYDLDEIRLNKITPTLTLLGTGALLNGLVVMVE
jgi:hypothetical protein